MRPHFVSIRTVGTEGRNVGAVIVAAGVNARTLGRFFHKRKDVTPGHRWKNSLLVKVCENNYSTSLVVLLTFLVACDSFMLPNMLGYSLASKNLNLLLEENMLKWFSWVISNLLTTLSFAVLQHFSMRFWDSSSFMSIWCLRKLIFLVKRSV